MPKPQVVPCLECDAWLTLGETQSPQIDSCGFENYGLECKGCGAWFVGIVDPNDDTLLLSVSCRSDGPESRRHDTAL
jgi:hypothetical protein